MKLFSRSARKDADKAAGAAPTPSWAKWAAQLGILVIVFLAGMFLRQAGDTRPPTLPPVYSLAVTPTLPPPPTPTSLAASVAAPGEPLPTLYIDIPPTYYEQLAAARREALELGILLPQNNVEVPAALRCGNADMPAQISLKGDWTDHLRGGKWSLRVRLDDNYYLFGMAVFSLQNPPIRQYANEWAYHASLRRDGLLGLRYRFVNVVLNGQPKGIYALEEGFGKELFEAQQRREGLILRYSEDLMWTWRSLYANRYVPAGVEAFYIVDEYQSGRIAQSPELSRQRQAAIGMLRGVWTGQLRAAEVFDVEQMGRFLALTNLWGGRHGLFWHNLRYFYNPVSARLEPIGFNANALDPASSKLDLPAEVFYGDPLLRAAYVQAALEVTSPEYVDQLEADLGQQLAALNQTLAAEFGELPEPWAALRQRAAQIRQRLQPYQTVYAYLPLEQAGVIDIGAFVEWPVEIVGIEFAPAQTVPLSRSLILTDSQALLASDVAATALMPLAQGAADVAYARFRLPPQIISLTASTPLTVVTRLLGGTEMQRQPVWDQYPLPAAQTPRPAATLEQALAQHPFLQMANPPASAATGDTNLGWLAARPGEWSVTGDLVLPRGYGLYIGPGTTLRFEPGAILVVSGGPALFEGAPDAPIQLTAAAGADTWGGMAVLEAGAPSVLRYVIIEKTGGLERAGWGLTGGVNFYKSPARIVHCRLAHIQNTDDAVNFVLSPFEVLDSEFEDTFADAIDADFSSPARVERCAFRRIGNDGLDVSGTVLTVRDVTMSDMGDKGVSVGENSWADIQSITVTLAYIGIAVKDGSSAAVRGVTISQARVAGLAAYTKKTEYGPAAMTASAVRFDGVERQTLVQTGNWIDLEGARVWGVEVDIEKLYLPFTKPR